MSWIESPKIKKEEDAESQPCARCGFNNPIQLKECQSCGVIFKKVESRQKDEDEGVSGYSELRVQWSGILADFENKKLHDSFLQSCQKANHLPYASEKYAKLEQAIGPEPMVQEMRDKIIKIASQPLVVPTSQSRQQSRRFKALSRPKWARWSNFGILVSALIISVGFMVPEGRNLIGVGAALGFLILAARISLGSQSQS